MKRFLLATTVITLALGGGAVSKNNGQMKECASQWQALKSTNSTGAQTYKQFTSICMAKTPTAPPPLTPDAAKSELAGIQADKNPRPVAPTAAAMGMTTHHSASTTVSTTTAPAGTTAVCKDGSTTKSKHHSGACSHHDGVAKRM